nr:unnamed protein product [Callosobruchus chinensis]
MSGEQDPLGLDAETLMQQEAENIEFVVDESDGENQISEPEPEPEVDPESGGVEDITILVESDVSDSDESSSQHSSYIDDYPDLEEVPTDQIKRHSKRIPNSKGKGTKRPRSSDDENSTSSKKVSTCKGETCPKLTTNPCFVPGCQLPKSKKVYFFRVPRNKILFQLWDILIKRPGVRLTGQCLVCQQHFHKDDILTVPGPEQSGGRLVALKKEALPCISYVQRCPVINCGLRVCNGHFRKNCFDENGELKSGSAPSENIPDFPHTTYMSNPSPHDLVTLPTPPLTGRIVKWLAATGHPNWICTSLEKTLERVKLQVSVSLGVCLDHFTSFDFVDASLEQLSSTAVPTRKGDQGDSIISLVLPVNTSPQQANTGNVTTPLKPILPAPAPATPGSMIPLLVANNGDTKVMLVPQEIVTTANPDFLQKLLTAAVSGGQPQTPSRPKVTDILPKSTPTIPKVTNILPRIPTPKVTPSMRRAAAANVENTDTIDLTGNKKGCCYVGCVAEPSTRNPLYNFPVDVERRKAWLRACGHSDLVYYKWLQVCKMHFTDDCFHEKGFLLADAVPTLPRTKPFDRPKPRPDGKIPCAVLRCINALGKDKCAKYRFPNPDVEPDRFEAWAELIFNPTLKYDSSVIYEEFCVCERHFDKVYYEKGDKSLELCSVAIPTLMVPGHITKLWFLFGVIFATEIFHMYFFDVTGRVTVEMVETDDVSLDGIVFIINRFSLFLIF